MIEINLLPGLKRKAAGGGARFKMPNLGSVLSQVKDPWLIGAIAAGVVALGGNAAFYTFNTARLSHLNTVLAGVQAEKRRYDAVAAQKRQAERARDSLSAELAIIRSIDADRFIWPHLLDEITKALPQYTWITQVQNLTSTPLATTTTGTTTGTVPADAGAATETHVSIDGRTVDIQAYTTFLRQLAASPWISDVTATRATTVIEQDRPVTEFNITLRYKRADSLYIRTVPLVESVR
ncbi:MAG TPA: PilN domain-containing protein [Gemmatimonadales bacterium]|nr:PilN domain-containing protein [Gemmatimonadales bacterium]